MLVQFVCNYYRNELGNPGKKQVGMKRFLILGFTSGNTKTVFEMVDGFLNIPSDFVGGIPFIRTADCTRVGTQIFSQDKDKPSCRRKILYKDYRNGRHAYFYPFPYHIPISFWDIRTSW